MKLCGPGCSVCVLPLKQADPRGDPPALLSTKSGAQSSPADDGAAKGGERGADVVADRPADTQAAEASAAARSLPPATQRYTPKPKPCQVPRRARGGGRISGTCWAQPGVTVAIAAGGDRRDRDAVRVVDPAVLASHLAPAHRGAADRWVAHRGRTGGRSTEGGLVAGPPTIARMRPASTAARAKPSRSAAHSSGSSNPYSHCTARTRLRPSPAAVTSGQGRTETLSPTPGRPRPVCGP